MCFCLCLHVLQMRILRLQFRVLDTRSSCSQCPVKGQALKKDGRGEQMADSLCLRQRATIHSSFSGLLCTSLARLISFRVWHRRVLVPPMQSKVSRQYSSLLILEHFQPFAQAGTVATGVRLSDSSKKKERKKERKRKKKQLWLFQHKY